MNARFSLSSQEQQQYNGLLKRLSEKATLINALQQQPASTLQMQQLNSHEEERTMINTEMAQLIFGQDEELEDKLKQAFPAATITVKILKNEETLEISCPDIKLTSADFLDRMAKFDRMRTTTSNDPATKQTMQFYLSLEAARQIMQTDCGSKGYLIFRFDPKERADLMQALSNEIGARRIEEQGRQQNPDTGNNTSLRVGGRP